MIENEKSRTYNYSVSTGKIVCISNGLTNHICPFCEDGDMEYTPEIEFHLPVFGNFYAEKEVVLPGYVCNECGEHTLTEPNINTLLTEVEVSKGNFQQKARVEGARVIRYSLQ